MDDYRYRAIAHLIGSIFFAGDFVAETANERTLEALLKEVGTRYTSWDEVTQAEINLATPPAAAVQPVGGDVRAMKSAVYEALAAIVLVPTPDKLFDLDAIPRDPVMVQVGRIKSAIDALANTPTQQAQGEAVPWTIQSAYDQGWYECAEWANRIDLKADTDSPAYAVARDARLAREVDPAALAGWIYDKVAGFRGKKEKGLRADIAVAVEMLRPMYLAAPNPAAEEATPKKTESLVLSDAQCDEILHAIKHGRLAVAERLIYDIRAAITGAK